MGRHGGSQGRWPHRLPRAGSEVRPQRRWHSFPDCGLSSGRDAGASLEVGGGVGASGHVGSAVPSSRVSGPANWLLGGEPGAQGRSLGCG